MEQQTQRKDIRKNNKHFFFTYSAQSTGLGAQIIRVEIDVAPGLYAFTIIGLGDKAVDEARDRVATAIKRSGFVSPKQRNQKIVTSLSPGNLKKAGTHFDLPIALAYLAAQEDIQFSPEKRLFIGELSLQGATVPVAGLLPMIQQAKQYGFCEVYIPEKNAREAMLLKGIKVYPCKTLKQIVEHLTNIKTIQPLTTTQQLAVDKKASSSITFADIKGQAEAKRALTVAAAGGHNIALYGQPGTGKTLLAKALQSVLPPLSRDESVEVTTIHSLAGLTAGEPIVRPPFRQPHHSASYAAVVGGGATVRPGEISLAHRGILFLDEFPEFDRRVIESLREPLEEHTITVARAENTIRFPSSCILAIAFNLCPCGNTGTEKLCTCTPAAKFSYRRKLTGPIVDRIDLWVEVEPVSHETLSTKTKKKEDDTNAFNLIHVARGRQKKRFNDVAIQLNSEIDATNIDAYISVTSKAKEVLLSASNQLSLSPRGHHRILKCARTIADLEDVENITEEHVLEAVRYRLPPDLV